MSSYTDERDERSGDAVATGESLLTVRDLQTEFRTEQGVVRAVDGIDFELGRGNILGIVGESGAGKSVTARSLLRLIERPGEIVGGTVQVRGDDVLSMSDAELRRGFRRLGS